MPGPSEGLPVFGALLSAAMVGQPLPADAVVRTLSQYFLPEPVQIFHDFPGTGGRGATGQSFW